MQRLHLTASIESFAVSLYYQLCWYVEEQGRNKLIRRAGKERRATLAGLYILWFKYSTLEKFMIGEDE